MKKAGFCGETKSMTGMVTAIRAMDDIVLLNLKNEADCMQFPKLDTIA